MDNKVIERYKQLKLLTAHVENSKQESTSTYTNGIKYVDSELFESWKIKVKSFIQKQFGGNSIYYKEFEKNEIAKGFMTNLTVFKRLKPIFDSLGDELEDIIETKIEDENNVIKNKVFIVHGHDDLAISEVQNTIIQLGLEPIVLRDQASSSKTIIEKIEYYTNEVGFAIILYTPCDLGGKTEENLKSRARQNVVLEHGYLMAKLGRENTCAFVKGDVETPGDIDGIVYIPMDTHGAWKYSLVDEMKSSNFNVSKDSL